jgi:hypothetical protein
MCQTLVLPITSCFKYSITVICKREITLKFPSPKNRFLKNADGAAPYGSDRNEEEVV